jgi:tetratricopeptide (TPR) repeat protein
MRRPCVKRRNVKALGCLVGAAWLLSLAACTSPKPAPDNAVHLQWQVQQQAGARALQRGDVQAARVAYLGALATAESIEDFPAVGSTLLNLAVVQARLGPGPSPHAWLDRLLQTPSHFPPALLQQAAARKALLFVDEGALADALRWADRAEAGCLPPCAVAPAMDNLRAHVALGRGDWLAATAAAQRAMAVAGALSLPAEQANGLRLAGRAALGQGDGTQAAALLAQALKIDQTLGLPERVALDLQFAAQAEALRGQMPLAREFYARAAVVREAMGDAPGARALRAEALRLAAP